MAATEPRSTPELVSLLLELARVVKARTYFSPGDPRLGPVFEHTRRAWTADLQRHGAIELAIEPDRLEQGGRSVPIDGRLAAPLSEWQARGVWRLRVEPGADAEALAGLVEVLALPDETVADEGGVGPALARRVPDGVRIEMPDDAPGLPVPKTPMPRPAAPARVAPAPEIEEAPTPVPLPVAAPREAHVAAPAETPSGPQPVAASAETSPPLPVADPPDETEPQPARSPAPPAEDDEPTLQSVVTRSVDTGDPTDPIDEPMHAGSDTEQTLPDPPPGETAEEDTQPVVLPLAESSGETTASGADGLPPSDAAATLLREIESSPGGPAYSQLIDGLFRLVASDTHGLGRAPTLRILAALAAECDAKRSEADRDIARVALERLTTGERLDAVIDQMAEGGPDAEQAAAVLPQLGGEGARALAVCALTETSPERAERLSARLLGLGPAAGPPILEAIGSPERETAERAIELAERMGSPEAVARIADQLRSADAFVREAAGGALARLARPDGRDDAQALRALARALSADDPQLPPLAMACLASTGSPRAVGPLASALHAAVEARDPEIARDLIGALGELGRPEAAGELGTLVLRRDLLGRRRLRELKLAATRALAQLPGEEAVGVLSQAARLRDTQVRDAAQTALERRSR